MLHKPSFAFMQAFGSEPLMVEMAAMDEQYDRPLPCDIADGVAIVEISGMLTASSWFWGSTYGEIRDIVARCIASPEVQGILLSVDSPGGSVDGAFELVADLVKAGKEKPIWCVADVNCYSAAYLLASTAAKIYQAPTSGGVGSIGVYTAHIDYSKALEKQGVNVTLISAGKGKTDGNPYEPLSKDAAKDIKANVDRLYDAFTEAVARNRSMTTDAVVGIGAKLFQGAASGIEAGLSDAQGTFETALSDFQSYLAKKKSTPMIFNAAAASGAIPTKEVHMDTQTTGVETSAATVTAPPSVPVAAAPPNPATISNGDETITLCAIAGCPERAVEFVGKPIGEVRQALLEMRAAKSEKAPISGSLTEATASPKATSPLLAAIDQMKGGK